MPENLNLRGYKLPLKERTLIMGILNVTPDSFSDGGKFKEPVNALRQAYRMAEEGADIIDVGGESTRPGSTVVPADEEIKRILPVVRSLIKEIKLPISLDTYKAEVARCALEEGVHMINDVWGFKADPDIAEVTASYDVPVCLMHNRSEAVYSDLVGEVIADLRESVNIALGAGMLPENIVLDPGIGFGKNLEHNILMMHSLARLNELNLPILLGTSRKSLIGKTLNLPVEERIEGTAATVALGIAAGVDIIRVHDIKEMKRVAMMTDAIVRLKAKE